MKAIERRKQTSGQGVPSRCSKSNPKQLLRLGCAALAVTLAIGSITFLRGFAAEDGAEEAAVSGSDIISASDFVSGSDIFTETVEPNYANANIVASGTCGTNVNWTLDSEGTLTISGSGSMRNKSYSSHAKEVKRVVIEDGVTTILSKAFVSYSYYTDQFTNLTSVSIGNSVKSIGEQAFGNCTALTSITFPGSVTSIGEGAFGHCEALTSITIPDSVTSIGRRGFSNCKALTSVSIGNGMTSIGEETFWVCSSLTTVNIPDSVTSIGKGAFSYCRSLTSIHIPDSVTSIGDDAFSFCHALASIRIPDSVTYIGDGAFALCPSLTSVNIPDGVTSIGKCTFQGCQKLTSLHIPDSVTSIGEDAFLFCYALTSLHIPDGVTSIGDSAFAYCEALTSVNIPDGVTSIGANTFLRCYQLTSIHIPDSVTSIGSSAFYSCIRLTSIHVPDSVTSIGEGAFYWCVSLTSAVLPKELTSIPSETFYNCKNLKTLTIGYVTSVGDYAFTLREGGVMPLKTVYYPCNHDIEGIKASFPNSPAFISQHAIVKVDASDATCTKDGSIAHWMCDYCHKRYSDQNGTHEIAEEDAVFPALGHDFQNYTPDNNATCTQNATKTGHCTRCGATDTIAIDGTALGHNMTKTDAVGATCTEGGNIAYWTCGVCHKSFSDEDGTTEIAQADTAVAALGHDWSNWITVTEATETTPGEEKRSCGRCHLDESRTIPAQPDDYQFLTDSLFTWTKGSADGMVVTVKNMSGDDTETFGKFLGVSVDGTELTRDVDYTAEPGSIKLTLSPDYLRTLAPGTHTLTIELTVTTLTHTFTVVAPSSSDTPDTGESIWLISVSLALLLLAAGGAAYAFIRRRRVAE